MTKNDSSNPNQSEEEAQTVLQASERRFPPELGDRASQPRLWTISRIESVIGSIA